MGGLICLSTIPCGHNGVPLSFISAGSGRKSGSGYTPRLRQKILPSFFDWRHSHVTSGFQGVGNNK